MTSMTAARAAMRSALAAPWLVAALVAMAGCAHGTAPAGTAPASASSPATASAAPAACNPDYCQPTDWDTARASTPLAQIAPFSEPLNVVISARSTISLAAIQQALGDWHTVSTATTASLSGIHVKCISSEKADVAGGGYVPQAQAWRLGGCVGGNNLSLSGNEDHVRIWHQPVPGSSEGAWFVAASYETMCVAKSGTLVPAASDKSYAALHPDATYHCVDGGPGSITTSHQDGYQDGAAAFAAAIVAAAHARGWQVSARTIDVGRTAQAGEGGVPFSGTAEILTVTS